MLFEDRARAESFGTVAQQYDRARPSYPAALVDALLQDGARDVLDVGCGTGIASVLIAARGCKLLGVEVDPRMAELARAKGLEVEIGRFEDWDSRDRRFDLLISAQAWHWIEPRAGTARAAEVLRAGGRIGVFWNIGDPPPRVRKLLSPIYTRLAPDLEKYSVLLGNTDARKQATLAGIAQAGTFGSGQSETFAWRRTYSTASWIDHLGTHSDHQALSRPRRERLFAAITEALEALGGSFEMSYETVLICARRI